MSNLHKDDVFKFKSFLKGLEEVISSLPKEGEKQRLEKSFSELISFLSELRAHMQLLPSVEQLNKVSAAAEELRGLLSRLDETPTLAAALGMRRAQGAKRRNALPTVRDPAKARGLLRQLESLSADQIRQKLSDESYPLMDVRAIASELGFSSSEKTARDELVHQIATKVVNYRGYRSLAEEEPKS